MNLNEICSNPHGLIQPRFVDDINTSSQAKAGAELARAAGDKDLAAKLEFAAVLLPD